MTGALTNIPQDRIDTYAIQCSAVQTDSPSGEAARSNGIQEAVNHYQIQAVASIKLNPYDVFCYCDVQRSQILSTRVRRSGSRVLELQCPRNFPSANTKPNAKPLWTASPPEKSAAGTPRITAMLPLELSLIILAYSECKYSVYQFGFYIMFFEGNGHIRKSSLMDLVLRTDAIDLKPAFDAAILSLHIVRRDHPRKSVIVGGGDDGSINFWDFRWVNQSSVDLYLRSFLPKLATTARSVNRVRRTAIKCLLCRRRGHRQTSRVLAVYFSRWNNCCDGHGCIGTVRLSSLRCQHVYSLWDSLYLIPGAPAPLQALRISSESVMLSYADRRSRLWDIRTREFFRSMSSDKSAEYLGQGHWYSPCVTFLGKIIDFYD